MVLTIKRDGKYKARWVLRGDFQNFDAIDKDDYVDADNSDAGATVENTFIVETTDIDDTGATATREIVITPTSETIDIEEEVAKHEEDVSSTSSVTSPTEDPQTVEINHSVFETLKSKASLTYRQLFSPTMGRVAMMLLLAIAVANHEYMFTADVSTAFLHAWLYDDERVYCRPPLGFENHPAFRGKITRLRKALYGLRQAPRRWWEHLSKTLKSLGMTRLKSDPCVWILDKRTVAKFLVGTLDMSGVIIKMAAHVDDFLITTNNRAKLKQWFALLAAVLKTTMFEVTIDGSDYMSLTLKYNRAERRLIISQRPYIEKLIDLFNLKDATPAETPMIANHAFTVASQPDVIDIDRRDNYRRLVASVNWIAQMTAGSLVLPVSILSRFLENPSSEMHRAAIRLIRYLKWTIKNDVDGLVFEGSHVKAGKMYHDVFGSLQRNQIYAYIDASHLPKDLEDSSKSRGGECHFVNRMLISASTSALHKVTLSSAESEYVILSMLARKTIHIREMANELHEIQDKPTPIAQDSSACIQIVENPGKMKGRTKHIAVDARWVEDEVNEHETIRLVKCPTAKMTADITTKALTYNGGHAVHAAEMCGRRFPSLAEHSQKRKI